MSQPRAPARCIAAYLYAASGSGESTTDLAWDGDALVYENGERLAEGARFASTGELVTADIDLQRLAQDRMRMTSFADARHDHAGRLGGLRRIRGRGLSPSRAAVDPAHPARRHRRDRSRPARPAPRLGDGTEVIVGVADDHLFGPLVVLGPVVTWSAFCTFGGRCSVVRGDLASLEAHSSVTFRGRGSRVINTGGEKVLAEKVEQVLIEHPGVQDALVVEPPDQRRGGM